MSESRLQRTIGRSLFVLMAAACFAYALVGQREGVEGLLQSFAYHAGLVWLGIATKPWLLMREQARWWPGPNGYNYYGGAAIVLGWLAAMGFTGGFLGIAGGTIALILHGRAPWLLPVGTALVVISLLLVRPVRWFLQRAGDVDCTHAT